ncbi:MAG: HAD family hydrolase [Bacteroidetes bacterium]|nr:HAD family hydrolase [Bacteroidota bacterium]MCL5738751.1 HAD family hydrolase [Bacteroidota bacterium]
MSNKFSLAIFDLDGTLADTSQLIFDSFNFVMRKYKSIEMAPSQIMSYFGPPEEIAIKNILGSDNFDSIWRDYLGYYEDHLNETEVFAGIPELLRALRKTGSHLAIFTGKGNNTTELTLKHHGIRDLFDVIVTGSIVKNHKPSPEGVELALSTLRVEPAMAVLVGDSLSDYRAATSAGIHFIAAMYDSLAKNRFDDVNCVKANSIRELSALLLPQHAHLD